MKICTATSKYTRYVNLEPFTTFWCLFLKNLIWSSNLQYTNFSWWQTESSIFRNFFNEELLLLTCLTWAGVLEPTSVSSSNIICGDVVKKECMIFYPKQIWEFWSSSKQWIPNILSQANFKEFALPNEFFFGGGE